MPQTPPPAMPNDAGMPPKSDAADPREALNLKKAEIKLLEQELSDIDAKLDAEFIDTIDQLMSTEELEMRFDDDVRAFLSLVEEKREAFYREKLDELRSTISKKVSEVANEEDDMDMEEAKAAFIEAHPDVDMEAMSDFFNNDLTQRQKDEIATAQSYLETLEKTYAMYAKKNKNQTKPEAKPSDEDNLPPNLSDVGSTAPVADPTAQAKDEGYLERIGIRRR